MKRFLLIFAITLAIITAGVTAVSGDQTAAGTWKIEKITEPVATSVWSSLVMDAQGHPHVSYMIESPGKEYNLKYAWNIGSGWQSQFVDTSGTATPVSSLALTGKGEPRIIYSFLTDGWSANYKLKIASWSNSRWKVQPVPTGTNVTGEATLKLQRNGNPATVYCKFTDSSLKGLFYARMRGSTWTSEVADGQEGLMYAMFRLDKYDRPHIVYRKAMPDMTMQVWYAWKDTAGWHKKLLDEGYISFNGGFALDKDGKAKIAYVKAWNDYDRDLIYWDEAISWKNETVMSGTIAQFCDLALDKNGSPALTYCQLDQYFAAQSLHYVWKDGDTWKQEMIHKVGGGDAAIAEVTALAFDSKNVPHLTFAEGVDSGAYHLMYGTRIGS